MSDLPIVEQPKRDMQEILDIIPKRKDFGETEKDVKRMIDYLKNPCVIEMKKIYEDSTIRPGYKLRLALGHRTSSDKGEVTRFKGVDIDTEGYYTIEELLNGKKNVGYRSNKREVFTYIGRLSDIENSNEPPMRHNIFEREIQMMSEEL